MANRIPWIKRPPLGAVLDGSHQLSQGLVGFWLLNENGGLKANDISGKYNIGTLTNTPIWNNDSLNFDGLNDYIDVANESNFDFDRLNSFSVSAWIKLKNAATRQDIVGKQLQAGAFPGWNFRISQSLNDGKLFVLLQNTSTTNRIGVRSNTTLNGGMWQHVAFTYDGSSAASGVKMYKNGTGLALSTEDDTLTASIVNNVNLNIGAAGSGTLPFSGFMTCVRIYNRVLLPQEAMTLYTQPWSGILMPRRRNITQQAAGGGVIKTWNGIAFASVKTFDSIAIASVKTIDGMAAQ